GDDIVGFRRTDSQALLPDHSPPAGGDRHARGTKGNCKAPGQRHHAVSRFLLDCWRLLPLDKNRWRMVADPAAAPQRAAAGSTYSAHWPGPHPAADGHSALR